MKGIILAGGKGKRVSSDQSDTPKVLRLVDGKPILGYVLQSLNFIAPQDIYIVVGYKQELVREFAGSEYNYAYQEQQLGTAHATSMVQPLIPDYDGDIFVLYGDMPLLTADTLSAVRDQHVKSNADCTILTDMFEGEDIPHFGRIIRENGSIVSIVEHKDCTEEQRNIREINVGPNIFKSKLLFETLTKVNNNNNQREYYLTAVPQILIQNGYKVQSYTTYGSDEIHGANTPEDLQLCERLLRSR